MKKNILLILPFFPYPLTSGGHQAIFNEIKALSSFANIYIIYHEARKDKNIVNRANFLKQFKERNIKIYPYVRKLSSYSFYQVIQSLCRIIKSKLLKSNSDFKISNFDINLEYISDDYILYIESLIKELKIDIVQTEMLSTIIDILIIPKNVKTVFVHHEIGYIVKQQALQELGITEYRKMYLDYIKMKEIELLKKYDRIITLSLNDEVKLTKEGIPHEKIRTSYAIIEKPKDTYETNEIKPILTFIGPEIHNPNHVGVCWFLENCWSLVLNKNPKFEFHIIGNWSNKTIKQINNKYHNIKFLGYVNDLSEKIKGTTLIVPITIGSGIRMKILEAASRKVPFVSTTIGVEGLPFTSGIDCIISDKPDIFVNGILTFQDKETRKRFTDNAFKIYESNFSLKGLTNVRKKIIEEL